MAEVKNLKVFVKMMDGRPAKMNGSDYTFGALYEQAILFNDKKIPVSEYMSRFDLMNKIKGKESVNLESDEITKIKQWISDIGISTYIGAIAILNLEGRITGFDTNGIAQIE